MTDERKLFLLDAAERVVWTLIQVAAGALLDQLLSGEVSWRAIGYAVGIAVLKVIVAGKFGQRNTAQALPGGTYVNREVSRP